MSGAGSEGDPQAEILRRLRAMIAGMDLADLRATADQVMGLAMTSPLEPATAAAAPQESRRRPRRAEAVTYRIRVDIDDTHPPVWRRLELSSTTPLDELHRVLQAAFGWTDSHLHRFALGPSVWDLHAEAFLCPYDVEDGESEGVPASEVRLDEVLVDVGDVLRYVYDYGDGWEHTLRLEAVLPPAPDAAAAICTAGRRAGPPEDCGGPYGYEELAAAGEVGSFDLEEVNAELRAVGGELALERDLPLPLADLLRRTFDPELRSWLDEQVTAADLTAPVPTDPVQAAEMVRSFTWLLERVGEGGIPLTAAGYLPPVHVLAAMAELHLDDEWIGKRNREDLTPQVLGLRLTAQRLGLLRKAKGRLVRTKVGQRVVGDPVALWWHVVERCQVPSPDTAQGIASLLVLVAVAAGDDPFSDDVRRLVRDVLTDHGWRTRSGAPLPEWGSVGLARDTMDVLEAARAFEPAGWGRYPRVPTAGGRALARAVLHRLPHRG